ncbi:hypothetical protein DQ393_26910 [Rhizobium tropici]|uniref:Uncharacterized protein n=1 Tax=Rhizobium tropici TaxID=398 RepID=A0A329Y593_RHITR|nr:hypothetical protein DQ393_26910 [Rhizobium tropici]
MGMSIAAAGFVMNQPRPRTRLDCFIGSEDRSLILPLRSFGRKAAERFFGNSLRPAQRRCFTDVNEGSEFVIVSIWRRWQYNRMGIITIKFTQP